MTSISWISLLWCLIPVIMISIIYWKWQGNVWEIGYASGRMLGQLVGIGFILAFLFESPSPWTTLTLLSIMAFAAGWIAMRPVKHHAGFLLPTLIALVVSVSGHLFITIQFVIDVAVWYDPRVLIPLAGMYFANAMNATSLAAERFHAERHRGIDGSEARFRAFHAALIPQINSLLAVGLVALPGMMTGQILSGVSPLTAVKYQILIMTMILGSSGLATALLLWQLSKQSKLYFKPAA